jgi:hypothetical protein
MVEERGGHVSGADLDHKMQFAGEATGGTGSDRSWKDGVIENLNDIDATF